MSREMPASAAPTAWRKLPGSHRVPPRKLHLDRGAGRFHSTHHFVIDSFLRLMDGAWRPK